MKYRFFLTSLIVAGLIRPAAAETFPADGYMQEDKTYENAATYTNTGVYEGEVNATAEYTDNVYNIAAGTYLPAGAEVAETCTAGSFCPGKTDATYDESAPQGITACPTGYPNSAAGAGAENQCYTACTLATANIAHATGVSGNDYYGDGTDTCAATDCDPGYHVEGGELKIVNKTPLIPVDYTLKGNGFAFVNANGEANSVTINWTGENTFSLSNESFDANLTQNNTWAVPFDYGIVYGHASCQASSSAVLYVVTNIDTVMSGDMSVQDFETGLAEIAGAAKAAYIADRLAGMLDGTMSEDEAFSDVLVIFSQDHNVNYSTDSIGNTCYCQVTGYTPTGGSLQSVAGAPWVDVQMEDLSAEDCAAACVSACSFQWAMGGQICGSAMLDAREVLESGGTCAANEIKINWTDADESDIIANEAGMCTFGGDIRTPVKAVAKKGKTFKGWKFEKSN